MRKLEECQSEYAGIAKGKTVMVIGNAPNLKTLERYRELILANPNIITIGVNYTYLFMPCHYTLALDFETWYMAHREIQLHTRIAMLCPRIFTVRPPHSVYKVGFPPLACYPYFQDCITFNTYIPGSEPEDVLSPIPEKGLFSGNSSICAAINFAYFLQPARIILVGVDLRNYDHYLSSDSAKLEGIKYPCSAKITSDLFNQGAKIQAEGIGCYIASPRSTLHNAYDYCTNAINPHLLDTVDPIDNIARSTTFPSWRQVYSSNLKELLFF
jgi:hypothetical protein